MMRSGRDSSWEITGLSPQITRNVRVAMNRYVDKQTDRPTTVPVGEWDVSARLLILIAVVSFFNCRLRLDWLSLGTINKPLNKRQANPPSAQLLPTKVVFLLVTTGVMVRVILVRHFVRLSVDKCVFFI